MMAETRFVGDKLSIDEFLAFRETLSPDALYELHDGVVVMKRPPQALQGRMTAQLATALVARYQHPYAVHVSTGILHPDHENSCLLPEVTVSDEPLAEEWLHAPSLVADVVSPFGDLRIFCDRLMLYRAIPSIRQVLVVRPHKRSIDLHSRIDGNWNIRIFINHAQLVLEGADQPLPLDELYGPIGM